MSILRPGFSERVFEFAFNAEYADRNRAILAAAPSIPTQNEEKELGYDVLFEVNHRGGAIHAVALQHKVARYVDGRAPTNHHFWSAADGPYFAFSLDTDQYNLVQRVSAAKCPGFGFHFCAPVFASRRDMNTHYLGKKVEANSIWIDVSGAMQITDSATHSIIFSEDGTQAFRFSSDAIPLVVLDREERDQQREQRQNATLGEVEEIYELALSTVQDYWPNRQPIRGLSADAADSFRLPHEPPKKEAPTLPNLAKLLAKYYGMSVLVEVRQ